jgi:hypothetical protein
MGILEKINHQLHGHGPRRLVFLHGLVGSGSNWARIVSQFDPNEWTILTYDQRGHGRSFQPETGYATEDYANDLKDILNDLEWNHIDLVGHSMGGRVAITFGALFPHRLRSLTIEDIGVAPSQSATSRIETWIESVPVPFENRRSAREFLQSEAFAATGASKDIGNFFYANLTEKENGVDWRFFKKGILESLKDGRTHDRFDIWSKLSMPTLLIRGERSTDLSPVVYEQMLKALPSCKGVVIAEAGHWVHFDQPLGFFNELNTFLKSF